MVDMDFPSDDASLLVCDLTQSYSAHGGGISTYLREKREFVLGRTAHRLLQIVPGPETRIVENGRHVWAEIAAPPVRGSEHYRFILDTRPVHRLLERYRPDLVESQCPWILPWTAINFRKAYPQTALVAGYHTDFPNAHVHRVASDLFGRTAAAGLRKLTVGYASRTYREFDRVYVLGEAMRRTLAGYGIGHVDVHDLGVDAELFNPSRRDPDLRASLGLEAPGPLLVYAGRIDNEKRADRLLTLFRALPDSFGASLLMIGDGKLSETIQSQTAGLRVALPGFQSDRQALARSLASADIYVSAMADETFGISIIEAQASGLPVVGVHSGAMPERVLPGTGLLGPVDDVDAMARNVMAVWNSDARAMGARARALVVERYSWERTFRALFGRTYAIALEKAARRNWHSAGLAHGLQDGLYQRKAG